MSVDQTAQFCNRANRKHQTLSHMLNVGRFALQSFFNSNQTTITPIIILGAERTGSTLLGDYLSSLKPITYHGEVLNSSIYPWLKLIEQQKWLARQIGLLKLQYRLRCHAGWDAAKVILSQMQAFNIQPTHLIHHFPGAKFIVIYRRSLLDVYVSLIIAKKTKQWFSRSRSNQDDLKIKIDIDHMLKHFEKVKAQYSNLLAHQTLMEQTILIDYAEIADEPQTVFRSKICPFIGIQYQAVYARLKKQQQHELSDIIVNFADVQVALSGGVEQLNLIA